MALPAIPGRGWVLFCDFGMARIHPEMSKKRRVVVLSPRSYNRRHGMGPGRCIVVPFSAKRPLFVTPAIVHFAPERYRSLTRELWAICDCVATVSHDRLQMGVWMDEQISPLDLERIEEGLRHAMGLQKRGLSAI